ncbi:hypothetical protein NM688_g2631 [Phlebia brevispora]|uniref:Uncharacterized protein n=1 Tax=Phlebia brevispora TaxID=194682 RepID=A0ACC1T814_9APHY|nr:hypothetical protein NM688_g2631 [Phlebia brevispora]
MAANTSSVAKPLKVTPSMTPSRQSASPITPNGTPSNANKAVPNAPDVSSPHELTAFVETLLEQLDAKFDDMSSQILERMTQMSTRVDALEAAIQDIINGENTTGQAPPSLPQSPVQRKNTTEA